MDDHEIASKIASAIDSAMKSFDGGKGINQSTLSELSKVPQPTISRTLKGASTPETKTLTKLVAVLGRDNTRLGETIASLLPLLDQGAKTAKQPVLIKVKTQRDKDIEEVARLAAQLDPTGLGMLLGRAQDLVKERPLNQSKTAKSST